MNLADFEMILGAKFLQPNRDYAIVIKFNENHLLCGSIFKDTILTCAKEHNIHFKTIHTFEV